MEKRHRDAAVDVYAYIEEIHKDTSFVAATDCVPSNRSSHR